MSSILCHTVIIFLFVLHLIKNEKAMYLKQAISYGIEVSIMLFELKTFLLIKCKTFNWDGFVGSRWIVNEKKIHRLHRHYKTWSDGHDLRIRRNIGGTDHRCVLPGHRFDTAKTIAH